jgi:glucose-1-phosphate cytidylyltransferase
MVDIGGRPILWHIMKHYAQYGFKEFVIALGYRAEDVNRSFLETAA